MLVYSVMPESREHGAARLWLQSRFEDPEALVGLCWPVLYSFSRLVTSRRVMGDDAVEMADAWSAAMVFLRQDNARIIEPGPAHASIATELLRTPGLASNDVPDAQIAALAVEHGLVLCSRDRGFARFDRLAWVDPLAD